MYKIQELVLDENGQNKDEKPDAQTAITMEGALDKLPSGRRKATFWNAWKRRYFQAKDGYLYCHQVGGLDFLFISFALEHNFWFIEQNSQSEKPNIIFQLVGGQVEIDNNMISIDDGVFGIIIDYSLLFLTILFIERALHGCQR